MFSRWLTLTNKKSYILQGPRRAGKSTLLKKLFPDYKYITLDDIDDLEWSKKDTKGFVESLGKQFIIDEAQRSPQVSLAVKKLIDEKRSKAILTGSSGMNLKDQLSDTLAGRIDFVKLPPCCFGENFGEPLHTLTIPLEYKDALQAKREFKHFLETGGFPEVLNNSSHEEKLDVLKNYKNTYFTRELAHLLNLENVEGLKAIMAALIRGLCSRYEINSLSQESGLSIPTTKKYLNSLISSGLAFKLYGHHLGPAKRYISKAKTYFIDQGLLCALSNEFSLAQSLENFVVSELEKRRQLGFIKAEEIFYYESAGGSEIDVLIEEKKRITLIEVKSSKKVTNKELSNLKAYEIKNTQKQLEKIVIYLGDEFQTINDIKIIPAWNFFRASGID